MSTASLDKLLLQASTREQTLQVLTTLQEGGGVITAKIKDKEVRLLLEDALREYGAVRTELGFWKKHVEQTSSKRIRAAEASVTSGGLPTASRPVFGAALPAKAAQEKDDEADDDDGPLPASAANVRVPQARSEGPGEPSKQTAATSASARGEWMMQDLKPTDHTAQLRSQVITSQTGRTFKNVKSTPGGGGDKHAIGPVDTRAVATGKAEPGAPAFGPAPSQSSSSGEFRWNHEEMMAVDKIDKSRLGKILSESIDSRFAPAGSTKRFL